MKKAKKIILAAVLLLVVVIAIAAIASFRTQPVLASKGDYIVRTAFVWPEKASFDNGVRTDRVSVSLTPSEKEQILDLLAGYEKKLSTHRLAEALFHQHVPFLPAQSQGMELEYPAWLQFSLYIENQNDPDDFFHLLLGDGHVQQRTEYSFLPPYYEVLNDQQLYQELDALLDLADRQTQLQKEAA